MKYYFLLTSLSILHAYESNIPFKLGIENIGNKLNNKKHLHSAIATNQTGIDHNGQRSIDALLQEGFNLKYILVPEHGLTGTIPAEKQVKNTIDLKTHLPIVSLYQGGDKSKTVPREIIPKIDVIFFDMQDSGMRHYTYISTLYKLLEFCQKYKKKLVVFDRPNPLGVIMEGPLVKPNLKSFISIAPIPLRHAMTIGELAEYFNRQLLKKPAQLTVIPMKDYRRDLILYSLPVQLSPKIPNITSCRGYSFLGLLDEIEGLFTTIAEKPFQVLMVKRMSQVPVIDWHHIKRILKRFGIHGTIVGLNNKQKDTHYIGLRINIANINKASAFNALFHILSYLRKQKMNFKFGPNFDKAIGTDEIQTYLTNQHKKPDFAQKINKELAEFYTRAKPYFLYEPYPKVTLVQVR